jgi:hypothetical protein
MKIELVDLFYLAMPEITTAADGSQDALLIRVCPAITWAGANAKQPRWRRSLQYRTHVTRHLPAGV